MDKVKKKLLKDALSLVNSTLKYYEADWISAQRAPEIEKTRVRSFEEFVEIRVNFEMSKIPELHDQVLRTGGHLFVCESLEEINTLRHRFKKANMKLNTPENFLEEEDRGDIEKAIREAREWFEVDRFSFNSVVSRVKIVLVEENNDK